MKSSDRELARATLAAILRLTKLGKMESIYEALEPAHDGAVHSFQNPAGTECIAGDSYVLTSFGLREIQHLHHTMKVWDGEDFHLPTKLVKYDNREGFAVTTEYGFALKGSNNHPIWTKRGWVALEDLTLDDEVLVSWGNDFWGGAADLPTWEPLKGAHHHITPPKIWTSTLAELAGMWLADGSLHSSGGSYGVRLSNGDEEVRRRFVELAELALGVPGAFVSATTRVDSASINAKEAVEFFKLIGLQGHARQKEIPRSFFRANKPAVCALLRGLTLDSHLLPEKGTIAFGTQSLRMQEQVHLLLANMGILASRMTSTKCIRLVIHRPHLAKFLALVGFVQTRKAEAVGRLLNHRYPERPEFDGWVKVVSKTAWRGDVYDVAMPKHHEYVANGLRVHNTTRFSHAGTWLFEPGSYNLATLPKKTALADKLYKVRDVIVPHTGRILGAADYSQAEARWCAWIANDPVRMKIYADEIDHYKFFVAAMKWDDPTRWREVDKAARNSIGKVGTLSGQYKVGWATLQASVNDDFDLHGVAIDAKTAKRMQDIWPALFPRTVEWWREVEEQVLTHGFTTNPFGRRRMYFGRRDSEGGKSSVVREAIADGPQSANAMALNGAMRRLYEKHDPHLMRLLLTVHDELLFDFAPRDLKRVAKVVHEEMEIPFDVDGRTLVIPAEVKASSESWGAMTPI